LYRYNSVIPQLDADGIDLMEKMLVYDPAKRIHATEAGLRARVKTYS
jgi:hypothetical protein